MPREGWSPTARTSAWRTTGTAARPEGRVRVGIVARIVGAATACSLTTSSGAVRAGASVPTATAANRATISAPVTTHTPSTSAAAASPVATRAAPGGRRGRRGRRDGRAARARSGALRSRSTNSGGRNHHRWDGGSNRPRSATWPRGTEQGPRRQRAGQRATRRSLDGTANRRTARRSPAGSTARGRARRQTGPQLRERRKLRARILNSRRRAERERRRFVP